MIVNLPEDAADTICRSIDLLILAVKSYSDEVGQKGLSERKTMLDGPCARQPVLSRWVF